ncbi:hypothetical protein [Clostridium perfringens]|uniref:CapR homology domain-containing protein n=1 Tax=Clostridium perfringens TaxID=1502 RepID=A0AAW9I737_CLOPF|nr:hypothetical protein [Clostridium perfringens]MBI6105889.1 hypothetical protein [Clostridium perfringens]MDZ4910051.1 hypothetical protein [Clostridium perfringens]MDZ5055476.1 hypothetical protein [Clostridium perfringens]
MSRKTHAEFVDEVDFIGYSKYLVLSEYKGTHKHVKMQHLECGHIWDITPHNFLKGRRCPLCANKSRAAKIEDHHNRTRSKGSSKRNIGLPTAMYEQLRTMAQDTELSTSAYIRAALLDHIQSNRKIEFLNK